MIHKKSQHLLRQIYSGRLAEDEYVQTFEENQKVTFGENDANTGGLNFKAIDEEDLQASREAYLREQDAWETGSQSTAVTGDTPMYRGPQQDYFEAAKRDYLANGPSSMAGGSRPGTPGSYELTTVNTNTTSDMLIPPSGRPGESRENLLYGGAVVPGGNFAGRGAGSPGNYQLPVPQQGDRNAYGQVSNPAAYESYEDINMDYYGYDRRYSNPALNHGSNVSLPPGAAPPAGMQGGLNGTPAPSYPTTFAYPPSHGGAGRSSPSQPQYDSTGARYSPPLYRGQAHTPPSASQQQPQYNQREYGHRQNASNASNQSFGRFNNGGYGGR